MANSIYDSSDRRDRHTPYRKINWRIQWMPDWQMNRSLHLINIFLSKTPDTAYTYYGIKLKTLSMIKSNIIQCTLLSNGQLVSIENFNNWPLLHYHLPFHLQLVFLPPWNRTKGDNPVNANKKEETQSNKS